MNESAAYVLDDGYPINLDSLIDLNTRIVIVVVSIIVLAFNGVAFVALNRTTHTPRTARFLSSALLVFDFVSVLLFTVRKGIRDGRINLLCQLLAMGWSFVAYVNIAIMSLERMLVLQWPNFYLRHATFSGFKIISLVIWSVCLVFYSSSMIFCLSIHNTEIAAQACFEPIMFLFIQVTVFVSAIISTICLTWVICLIRRHGKRGYRDGTLGSKRLVLASYKSTVVVCLCCLNYLIIAVFYGGILIITVTNNVMRRVYMDLIMILNGFADSCVYVWWFKECRLEVLKIISSCFPSLNTKVQTMRLQIFDIVTYSSAVSDK